MLCSVIGTVPVTNGRASSFARLSSVRFNPTANASGKSSRPSQSRRIACPCVQMPTSRANPAHHRPRRESVAIRGRGDGPREKARREPQQTSDARPEADARRASASATLSRKKAHKHRGQPDRRVAPERELPISRAQDNDQVQDNRREGRTTTSATNRRPPDRLGARRESLQRRNARGAIGRKAGPDQPGRDRAESRRAEPHR